MPALKPVALLAGAALTPLVPAQPTQFQATLPTSTFWVGNNEPFAGVAPKRYQQWFSASAWTAGVGRPVRVVGVDFPAWTPGNQTGAQVDIEVTMAHGPAIASGLMDDNLVKDVVVVVPRSTHTLGTAAPGSYPLTLSFKAVGTEFAWDGQSSVVVDIKLWNNGKGNRSYSYDLQATFSSIGQVTRLWGFGDPRSTNQASFYQPNAGLAMRFNYEEGISVPFGSGCPGAGGFVPVASTSGGHPVPANAAWTQTLRNANAQKSGLIIFGASRTKYGPFALPLNLRPVAPLCDLLVSLDVALPITTIGGGPGSGSANFATPVPPVTVFVGLEMYTQWLVLDSQSLNGPIVLSNGVRSIFG
jgi:hypothetical protein